MNRITATTNFNTIKKTVRSVAIEYYIDFFDTDEYREIAVDDIVTGLQRNQNIYHIKTDFLRSCYAEANILKDSNNKKDLDVLFKELYDEALIQYDKTHSDDGEN